MARPIKETPILKGKDAERFQKRLQTFDLNGYKETALAKENPSNFIFN